MKRYRSMLTPLEGLIKSRVPRRRRRSDNVSSPKGPDLGALSGVVILEWRHTGHNLAYVDSIYRAGVAAGVRVSIVTTGSVWNSQQFAKLDDAATTIIAGFDGRHGWRRQLALLSCAEMLVLQHPDDVIGRLVLLHLLGVGPRRLSVVLLRPPSASITSRRGRGLLREAKGVMLCGYKWGIVRFAGMFTSIDLHLLECPVMATNDWYWSAGLARAGKRIFDPVDLVEKSTQGVPPPEVVAARARGGYFLIAGTIDVRKHIPVLLEAWRLAGRDAPTLLIAGRHGEVERELVRVCGLTNVVSVDRFLEDRELSAVLAGALGVFCLSHNPSGILLAAVGHRVPVVAREGTRAGRAVGFMGLGTVVALDASAIASVVGSQIAKPAVPPISEGATRESFGRQVLGLDAGTTAS